MREILVVLDCVGLEAQTLHCALDFVVISISSSPGGFANNVKRCGNSAEQVFSVRTFPEKFTTPFTWPLNV